MDSDVIQNRRRQKRSVARRISILEAAIATFGAHGYEGASIREIAANAGVPKGLVSYYFPAKEDLLFEITHGIQRLFLNGLTLWTDGVSDPRTQVRLIVAGHVELICARANQARIAFENFRRLTPARRRIVQDQRNLYEHSLSEIVQECLPASCHASAGDRTRAILGMASWVYQWYSPEGPNTAQELGALVGSMAVDALGCTSGATFATSRR